MYLPSQKNRSIFDVFETKITVTKQKSALTQEDVFGLGDGIIFEHDSRLGQHPTTTTYERGGRF